MKGNKSQNCDFTVTILCNFHGFAFAEERRMGMKDLWHQEHVLMTYLG